MLALIIKRVGLVPCKCLSKRKKLRSRLVLIYKKDLRQRSIDAIDGFFRLIEMINCFALGIPAIRKIEHAN